MQNENLTYRNFHIEIDFVHQDRLNNRMCHHPFELKKYMDYQHSLENMDIPMKDYKDR